MTVIREPCVAGQFYPGDAGELSSTLRTLLSDAPHNDDGPPPKALIVPHAGYQYSGPVAAAAYARLVPYRDRYTRVVLLGPCHRMPLRGLALSTCDAFRTPAGLVPLDTETIARLRSPGVLPFEESHEYEHSIEVHLPFLQAILSSFSIVPIVVGDADPESIANVIDAVWGSTETLIVVSSDLSHYLSYEDARRTDAMTCREIENLSSSHIFSDDACGARPIGGLLLAARRHHLHVETLDLRNSGDTTGKRDLPVVGYGAWLFSGDE